MASCGEEGGATLFVQADLEEILNGIGIPLLDAKRLLHDAVLIKQTDGRVGPSHVLDGQPLKLLRFLALHKRLHLGILPQFSSTHRQLRKGKHLCVGVSGGVILAAA